MNIRIIMSLIVLLVSSLELYSATQEERLTALEGVALYIPSDDLPDDLSEMKEPPSPSDIKSRFNLTDAQLLQDIIAMTQRYSKSETNEDKRICRSSAVLWLGGYGTTNNLPYLRSIMYDNTDYAQRNALFSVINITMKTDGLFPMLHSVMTNKTVFSEGLRSSVCYQMHAWCDKKGSSGYIEDPVLHARVAAFFLERAGLEDGFTLYVDQGACELNPTYKHSQKRRENLAKLRKPNLTGLPAKLYDEAQRDALPKESK